MEKIVQIENFATDNLELADSDEKLAKKMKKLAKSELKISKILNLLTKSEAKLNQLSVEIAETIKESVEKKMEVIKKGILKLSEDEIKQEIKDSLYTGKVALIQNVLTDLNRQKADLEQEISIQRNSYADEKINLAKKQRSYSEKLREYINSIKRKSPQETSSQIKEECEKIKNILIESKKAVKMLENSVKQLVGKLASLEKEMASNISDLEKIRRSYQS